MTRQVACHKGKCWELKDRGHADFDDLFKADNFVDEIEKQLWRKTVYGK